MSEPLDLEELLRRALAPVDPPLDLPERLEARLHRMAALAVEELETFEVDALRDPRNWSRLAAAGGVVAAGAGAGTALVVLRMRRRARRTLRDRLRLP